MTTWQRIAAIPAALVLLVLPGCRTAIRTAGASAAEDIPGAPAGIPMTYRAHLAVIPVMVDGTGPHDFVLDTGAGITVLDQDLVTQLELPVLGKMAIGSPMGAEKMQADSLRIRTLKLGDVVVEDTPAVVMDLKAIFRGIEPPAGILSAASFEGMLLTLDYPHDVARLEAGQLPPADGRRVLDYDGTDVVPRVPVTIASDTLHVTLDTGSPSDVAMPSDRIATLPLVSEPAVVGMGRTVDAEFEIVSSQLDGTLRIGQHAIEKPNISFSERMPWGHMGMGILGRYAVTIDRTNRRIAFDEPQGTESGSMPQRRVVRGAGKKSYGIMLAGLGGDTLEVRGVEAGLPAAKGGLQGGDRIVAINGTPVGSLSQEDRMRHLRGSPLELQVERGGSTIELTLALE